MKTIQVKPWHATQGEFVIINEEDFDPEKHEKYEAPKLTKAQQAAADAAAKTK